MEKATVSSLRALWAESAAGAEGGYSTEDYLEAIEEMDAEELREACEHWGLAPGDSNSLDTMKAHLRQHYLKLHSGLEILEPEPEPEPEPALGLEEEEAATKIQAVHRGNLSRSAASQGLGAALASKAAASHWLSFAKAQALARRLLAEEEQKE